MFHTFDIDDGLFWSDGIFRDKFGFPHSVCDYRKYDRVAFDRKVLQVFKEQKDRSGMLTYPLMSQKHAIDFIELMNRRGLSYQSMCQAINEKPEIFRSWRLGNGNHQVGLIVMERVNRALRVFAIPHSSHGALRPRKQRLGNVKGVPYLPPQRYNEGVAWTYQREVVGTTSKMCAPTAVEMDGLDAVNCGHRLATISTPSQSTVSYREAVLSVVQQLRSQDVIAIKFLLSDIIPAGQLELLKSGLDIVSELENAHCLIGPPCNVQFLAELFYHVGRHDLLEKLNYTEADIESLLNSVQKPHVSPYRLMLHGVCQELRRNDVETLKFLSSNISPASLDSILDAHDLFRALETRRLLSPNSLDYIVSKLSQIPRMDLINHIKRFQTAYQSSAVCSKSSLTTELAVFSQSVTISCADSCLSAAGVAENGISQQSSSTVSQPSQILQQHVRDNAYPMRSNPRGICLIINNKTFHQKHGDETSKKMPDRKGTDVDRDNLQKIFEELKFLVEIENDLTAEEMVQKFRRVAEYDHRQYDCFVCCVLSHGECGTVYGVNGRVVSIRDLTSNFKAVSCPSLVGKPKLFFIQACQGSSRQSGFADATADLETDNDGTADPNNMVTIPEEADFLLGLATVPGFVSYRSGKFGSWYIRSLVRNLREFGGTEEILHILTRVNAEVSEAHTRGLNKQVPMPMYTLRKALYLK